MKFYKKRYRELLKYSQQLEKEGKHLFDVSESDGRELLRYSAKTDGHLIWESRHFYAELMDKFLKGKISQGELLTAFLEIEEVQERVLEVLESNLIVLSPNPNSDYFGNLTAQLSSVLDNLPADSTLSLEEVRSLINENKYEEAEEKKQRENYNDVKEIYLEMQNLLDKDSTTFQNDKNFSKLVDDLHWETKDQYFELIEEFLDGSSNFLTFKEKSELIVRVAKELESNSIFLTVNYQALGFSNYIHTLLQYFDRYQMDAEFRPKVFNYWVQKTVLEMKNHYS